MSCSRRDVLQTAVACSPAVALVQHAEASLTSHSNPKVRRFPYVQIDVFSSHRLEGNPLCVFTDASGLSDAEMQDLARETNLQETTFVFPRDRTIQAREGVKVWIFTPAEELPFAGHPTLGTAAVLLTNQLGAVAANAPASTITLDLKAGKVQVFFHQDAGGLFGEMKQLDPVLGQVHDRNAVAEVLGLDSEDLEADVPVQTISTGLPFAIVPIRRLSALQSLRVDFEKVSHYLKSRQDQAIDFYYVTRDTGDSNVRLRARSLDALGEDPATGSAAGCAAAWMVEHGAARPRTCHLNLRGPFPGFLQPQPQPRLRLLPRQ